MRDLRPAVVAALLIGALAAVGVLAIGEDPNRPIESESYEVPPSGRALLRWWEVAGDGGPASEVRSYYADSAEVTVPALKRQRSLLLWLFREAKPRIVKVHESGSSSRILAVVAQLPPHYFMLVREDSHWKLADNTYLTTLAASEEATLRRSTP
jgi:hypothetical protein